jgi:hypothetical protein
MGDIVKVNNSNRRVAMYEAMSPNKVGVAHSVQMGYITVLFR